MTDAYIYDAVRTPRGKGRKDGSLHEVTPVRLAVTALQAVRDRNKLDTHLVDDIVLGCVMPIGEQGADIARTASVMAGFAETVSGVQVNRFCASGLEATNMAAAQVMSGQSQAAIGGGVESMSRVPMGSSRMGKNTTGARLPALSPSSAGNSNLLFADVALRTPRCQFDSTRDVTTFTLTLHRWLAALIHRADLPPDSHVRANRARLHLFGALLGMFTAGGVTGAAGFKYIGFVWVVPFALVLLALSLPPFVTDLQRLRLPFTVAAPAVDETPLPGEPPAQLAQRLALAKARSLGLDPADFQAT